MKCIGILRRICGVDQTEVAARAGISRKSLNDFERGEAFPVRDTCKRVDDAMAAILEERLFAAARELPAPSERLTEPPPEPTTPAPTVDAGAGAET